MKVSILPKPTPTIHQNFIPFLSYYNPETNHFLFSSYLLKKRRLRKYALRVSHMFFHLVEREYIAVLFNNIKTYISFKTSLIRSSIEVFPLSAFGRTKIYDEDMLRIKHLDYHSGHQMQYRNISTKHRSKEYFPRSFFSQLFTLNKLMYFNIILEMSQFLLKGKNAYWLLFRKRRISTARARIMYLGFILRFKFPKYGFPPRTPRVSFNTYSSNKPKYSQIKGVKHRKFKKILTKRKARRFLKKLNPFNFKKSLHLWHKYVKKITSKRRYNILLTKKKKYMYALRFTSQRKRKKIKKVYWKSYYRKAYKFKYFKRFFRRLGVPPLMEARYIKIK